MKEKILAFLVTKLPGTQKAYLEGIADNYAKTITEESKIEETLTEGVISALKASAEFAQKEGDRRATDATQTAVSNYEKKHNIKDGKPVQTEEPPKNDDGEKTPEWAKSLIEANKKLQDRLDAVEAGKVTDTRKKSLTEAIKDSPEEFKTRIEKDFSRMNFESDEDYTSWLDEVKSDAGKLTETVNAKGSTFGPPKGGGQGSKDEVPQAMLDKFEGKTDEKTQNF